MESHDCRPHSTEKTPCNTANRTEKGEVKDARYIIVIRSVVWYNFNVVNDSKSEVYGGKRQC